MVTTAAPPARLDRVGTLLRVYLGVVAVTLVVLVVLSTTAPHQAPAEAWGHAAVVSVFALVLPARLRAARTGSEQAVRAVGIIAGVLAVVNVVEALVPGFVPVWMRVEMIGIAVLMLGVVGLVVRVRR